MTLVMLLGVMLLAGLFALVAVGTLALLGVAILVYQRVMDKVDAFMHLSSEDEVPAESEMALVPSMQADSDSDGLLQVGLDDTDLEGV